MIQSRVLKSIGTKRMESGRVDLKLKRLLPEES